MRVLVVASDHVGSKMAGPGIRSYRFAQELSRRFDVTLLVPYETDIDPGAAALIVQNPYDARAMTRLTREFDAVVAQRLPVPTLRALAHSNTRTVYDLYAPLTIENLAFDADRRLGRAERAYYGLNTLVQQAVLRYGDAFICASEKQRDLWLGALLALGRIDHASYGEDRTLRALVDVVPFGIEPNRPSPGPALRGVVPGIDERSVVLLWPGGIWNWFDPLTVIRAVAAVRETHPELWLVFLGIRHPNPGVPEMEMTNRALALADELGVRDAGVYFNPGWVPYDQRGAYLLDADLGVSAHFDDLETRFAYRTRLLDCFWAGLPVITTSGDALGELVAERGLGQVVSPGDVNGWTAAIRRLVDNRAVRADAQHRLAEVREELAWPHVVKPLERLLHHEPRRHSTRRDTTAVSYIARRLDYALASRGPAGAAVRLGRVAVGRALGTLRRHRS
jgi:glycosyltransferase involved in cell wall biosynthesis